MGVSLSSASVKGEIGGELAASSGVSTPGSASSAADSTSHDIITEQPRAQHTLQPDSVDMAACDLTSTATDGDEEDMLSHSSSQVSAVPSDPAMDLNGGTQASSPISDSSQTTTEGPDSAVTPSDSSEIVSAGRGAPPSAEGSSLQPQSGPHPLILPFPSDPLVTVHRPPALSISGELGPIRDLH